MGNKNAGNGMPTSKKHPPRSPLGLFVALHGHVQRLVAKGYTRENGEGALPNLNCGLWKNCRKIFLSEKFRSKMQNLELETLFR